jgi:hypothetical protein
MNRTMTGAVAIAVALLSTGCVARITPARVVVAEPAPPPAVVVTQPAPPTAVVVTPAPVVVQQPPVIVAPPRVVIVPGTQVYTVPSASFNVFVYGGHYYSFHQGTWFHAPRHGAPWTPVAANVVPAPVRSVPVKHWKFPPGQEKKMERAEHDRDDDCRGRGHGKKGKC